MVYKKSYHPNFLLRVKIINKIIDYITKGLITVMMNENNNIPTKTKFKKLTFSFKKNFG